MTIKRSTRLEALLTWANPRSSGMAWAEKPGSAAAPLLDIFVRGGSPSNCRFNTRSSLKAWSSMPSPISLLTKDDNPASSCSSGRAIRPAPCMVVRAKNAIRAHSTAARCPAEADGGGDSRAGLVVKIGEVETLFSDRRRKGVMGAEFDRLEMDLAATPDRSAAKADVLQGLGGGAFAASPRDFKVALIMCTASDTLSLSESSAQPSWPPFALAAPVFAPPLALDCADRAGFAVGGLGGFVELEGASGSLQSSRILRDAAVAALQVDVEVTAIRMASTWTVWEAMH